MVDTAATKFFPSLFFISSLPYTENFNQLFLIFFSEERDNGLPKTWSRQKHIFTGNITEIEPSMDNNQTLSKIIVTKTHSLIIRNVQESDLGLYFCKAPYIDSLEKSFNYLIDRELRFLFRNFFGQFF